MDEQDEELIERALQLNCINWAEAGELAKLAASSEGKERLRKIESALHKKEKYLAECL